MYVIYCMYVLLFFKFRHILYGICNATAVLDTSGNTLILIKRMKPVLPSIGKITPLKTFRCFQLAFALNFYFFFKNSGIYRTLF